jgi:hypothetical protein
VQLEPRWCSVVKHAELLISQSFLPSLYQRT